MELIYQRTPHQCTIATVSMATGRDYDEVLRIGLEDGCYVEGEGCRATSLLLEALGYNNEFQFGECVGDFISLRRDFAHSAESFRLIAWGRRAILSVPSLNKAGGSHSVFWSGRELFDPNPPDRKRYAAWDELLPTNAVLFREREG